MMTIDLNCDMGEREDLALGVQESLMECVTSANIACGAHAGNVGLMQLTIQQALVRGVAIGAHPGYPDQENFGRFPLEMPLADLEASIENQIVQLARLAGSAGTEVRYVKPHGALYNQAAVDLELARAIARAVFRAGKELAIVGLAGSPALAVWSEAGFRTVPEAFADRRYEPDGSLRPRRFADALLESAEEAAEQALRLALRREVVARDGAVVNIEAQTLCIHGDSPKAVEMARGVRKALEDAGIAIRPWWSAA
jgi:UPF0271 protein